jgi:hypothetical protein
LFAKHQTDGHKAFVEVADEFIVNSRSLVQGPLVHQPAFLSGKGSICLSSPTGALHRPVEFQRVQQGRCEISSALCRLSGPLSIRVPGSNGYLEPGR